MKIKKKDIYELLKGKEVSLNKVKGSYEISEAEEKNFKVLYKLKLKLTDVYLDEKIIDVTTNDVELNTEEANRFIDVIADKTKEVLRECELELKEQETLKLEEDLVKRLENRLKMESLKLPTEDDLGLKSDKEVLGVNEDKTDCFNYQGLESLKQEVDEDKEDKDEGIELRIEDKLQELLKGKGVVKDDVTGKMSVNLGNIYDVLNSIKNEKEGVKGVGKNPNQPQRIKIDLSPLFEVLNKGMVSKELKHQKDTKKGAEDVTSELMNELIKIVLKKQIFKGVGGSKSLIVSTIFDMLNNKEDEIKSTNNDNKEVNNKEELIQLIKDLGVGLGGIEVNKDKLKQDAKRVDEQDGKIKLDKESDADRDWYN